MTQNDQHVNDATEPTGDASPVGFCPYCDYRLVAIGTCPECGETVTQQRLRSRPRRDVWRRWGRRVVYIALLAGALFGGWRLYQSDFWLRQFSVERLASWSATFPRAQYEIDRRHSAGELGFSDLQCIVRERFQIDANIIAPRPCDLPLLVRFKPRRGVLDLWCNARVKMLSLSIDGAPAANLPEPMDYVFNLKEWTNRHNPEIFAMIFKSDRPLPVGTHSLNAKFEIEMCFGRQAHYMDQTLTDLTTSFTMLTSVRQEFEVVEQSVADMMISPVSDEDRLSVIEDATVSVGFDRTNSVVAIYLHENLMRSGLTGRFELTNVGDVSPIATIPHRRLSYHWRNRAVGRVSWVQAGVITVAIADGEAFRMRFVPEPAAQFDDGYDSCFPFVLEWDAVEPASINSDDSGDVDFRAWGKNAPKIKPDRAIHWSDYQGAGRHGDLPETKSNVSR